MMNVSTNQTSNFTKISNESIPHYFIVFSFGVNLVLGIPPHCYILWLSMKELIRGQSVEVFVFNISLIEVFYNFSLPFVIKLYFFNCPQCLYVNLVFGLTLSVGRPLFQTCICVERYIGVLHPVTFMKIKPIKYRISITIIGWILIICSLLLIGMGIIDYYNLLLPAYITFLSTKVFCCLRVLKALKRPGPGEDIKKKDAVSQDKVKAFRIIQIILVSAVLTYAPTVICCILYQFIAYSIIMIPMSICVFSGIVLGFVQPVLYLRRIRKVRLCFSV